MSSARRTFALPILAMALAGSVFLSSPAGAAVGHAGVVIVHSNGKVKKDCVALRAEQTNGLQLLRQSRFEFKAAKFDFGPAICWIDGEGVDTRNTNRCFPKSGKYWDYWNQNSGDTGPTESSVGVKDRVVHDGDIDYFSWGAYPQSTPPTFTFSEICPR